MVHVEALIDSWGSRYPHGVPLVVRTQTSEVEGSQNPQVTHAPRVLVAVVDEPLPAPLAELLTGAAVKGLGLAGLEVVVAPLGDDQRNQLSARPDPVLVISRGSSPATLVVSEDRCSSLHLPTYGAMEVMELKRLVWSAVKRLKR